jgi:hypothetical protein
MELPKIKHAFDDDASGVRYVVLAYRDLARREVLSVIRTYLSNTKRRQKRGATVTIQTVIS